MLNMCVGKIRPAPGGRIAGLRSGLLPRRQVCREYESSIGSSASAPSVLEGAAIGVERRRSVLVCEGES
jgi:hypothetical protein